MIHGKGLVAGDPAVLHGGVAARFVQNCTLSAVIPHLVEGGLS
jgi:hypothetical protein